MRRFVYWYLPVTAGIIAAVVFGAGFYSFLRGDTGTSVTALSQRTSAPPAAQRTVTPIILGDSLARGAGDRTGLGIGGRLDQELQRRKIAAKPTVNIAVNGARTADLQRQLESANVRSLISEANLVIVSIGGNDLWGGTDWRNAPPPNPEAVMNGVLDRIESIVKTVRQANPKARIFLIGLYSPFGPQIAPLVTRWNAREIDRFSRDPNVTVVQTADIFSHHDRLSADRFHPGDEGYELIARRIADAL